MQVDERRSEEGMGETREMLEPQDKRRQSAILHQGLALQARECETDSNGLTGIHGEEKKQASKYRAYNGRRDVHYSPIKLTPTSRI